MSAVNIAQAGSAKGELSMMEAERLKERREEYQKIFQTLRKEVRKEVFKKFLKTLFAMTVAAIISTAIALSLYSLSFSVSGILEKIVDFLSKVFGMSAASCGMYILLSPLLSIEFVGQINRTVIHMFLADKLQQRFGAFNTGTITEPILYGEFKQQGYDNISRSSYLAWDNKEVPFRVIFAKSAESNKKNSGADLFDGVAVAVSMGSSQFRYSRFKHMQDESYWDERFGVIIDEAFAAFEGMDVKISMDPIDGICYLIAARKEEYFQKKPKAKDAELWHQRAESLISFVEKSVDVLAKLKEEILQRMD